MRYLVFVWVKAVIILKGSNPLRNAHSPFLETVPLNELSDLHYRCDVTNIQSATQLGGHDRESTDRADADTW